MAKSQDEKKEAYWRRQVVAHESSGISVATFCRRRRIPVHQFYWWRRRLALLDDVRQAENEPAFVPVRLPAFVFSAAVLEIVHPGGCVVRVSPGFDRDSLRRVLDTLGAPPSAEA